MAQPSGLSHALPLRPSAHNKQLSALNYRTIQTATSPCTRYVCYGVPYRFQKFGDAGAARLWDGGMADPRNMPILTCYFADLVHFKSNGTNITAEIRLKNMTTRVLPFNVTQGHQN